MEPVGKYTILESVDFEKVVKKNLTPQLIKILDRKIKYLAENPRHPSLNTKKLTVSQSTLTRVGADEVWEFRINMSFRCVYYVIHAKRQLILALAGNHQTVDRKFPK